MCALFLEYLSCTAEYLAHQITSFCLFLEDNWGP